MKKLSFLLILIALFAQISFAQLKIGYVDSDAIMQQLPDVQDIQRKLDNMVQEWQDELEKMQNDWKKNYDDYEKRKLILSDQKRIEIEKSLMQQEREIADFRQKKFGANGELFQQEEKLMEPIQNRIFNAIDEVAKEGNYDFIFDRSGDILFLYAKEKYDVTSLVIEKLK